MARAIPVLLFIIAGILAFVVPSIVESYKLSREGAPSLVVMLPVLGGMGMLTLLLLATAASGRR